jgi:hypothetical protein
MRSAGAAPQLHMSFHGAATIAAGHRCVRGVAEVDVRWLSDSNEQPAVESRDSEVQYILMFKRRSFLQ